MKLSWRVCLGVKDVKKKGELERFVWWFRKVSGGGHIDANKEYRLRLCHRYFLERISHVPSHDDKAGSLAPILPHHFCLH